MIAPVHIQLQGNTLCDIIQMLPLMKLDFGILPLKNFVLSWGWTKATVPVLSLATCGHLPCAVWLSKFCPCIVEQLWFSTLLDPKWLMWENGWCWMVLWCCNRWSSCSILSTGTHHFLSINTMHCHWMFVGSFGCCTPIEYPERASQGVACLWKTDYGQLCVHILVERMGWGCCWKIALPNCALVCGFLCCMLWSTNVTLFVDLWRTSL